MLTFTIRCEENSQNELLKALNRELGSSKKMFVELKKRSDAKGMDINIFPTNKNDTMQVVIPLFIEPENTMKVLEEQSSEESEDFLDMFPFFHS